MQIFENFLQELKELEKVEDIPHEFNIGISFTEDRHFGDRFFYVFSRYRNHKTEVFLMKEFTDEELFKREVNALKQIFDCKVYSDTYDLQKLDLVNFVNNNLGETQSD